MQKKNSTKKEAITLETLMVGATTRGLGLEMFFNMSPGQIIDYCIEYNNTLNVSDNEEVEIVATQLHFDRF